MIVRSLALTALPLIAANCAPVERQTDANPAAGAPAVTIAGGSLGEFVPVEFLKQ